MLFRGICSQNLLCDISIVENICPKQMRHAPRTDTVTFVTFVRCFPKHELFSTFCGLKFLIAHCLWNKNAQFPPTRLVTSPSTFLCSLRASFVEEGPFELAQI